MDCIEREEIKKNWGNVESKSLSISSSSVHFLSMSSFSLHVLLIFLYSLHFLTARLAGWQAGTTCAALPTSIPTFQKYSAVMNYGQGFEVGCQEAEHGDNQKIATLNNSVILKVWWEGCNSQETLSSLFACSTAAEWSCWQSWWGRLATSSIQPRSCVQNCLPVVTAKDYFHYN